ncbi:hypothetical protein DAPPUDRAFT_266503 [Daphnia pulex]|uniref:Uncharacterized protein n=1 Tax=Daphnia pulex TaxID=6669 RepID=E9HV43_DAPPU|nr:hypothetical protein DAPPUDRAFT_266503 [Daphnia pulex]|eukprot:EFX64388.1 hypothetical protein DAPPUDRAFT_266503 [Daphnia pulex]
MKLPVLKKLPRKDWIALSLIAFFIRFIVSKKLSRKLQQVAKQIWNGWLVTEQLRMRKKTADRREEDRLRTELQREHQFEREREEEELRARNALQHAEIVPVETADHEAFLREMHLDRNRAGNRRTHRIACKDIVVEDRVHLLDIGDLTKIFAECDAKHFEKEMPKYQKFQRCCGKGKVIITYHHSHHHHQSHVRNPWPVSCKISIQSPSNS